MAKISMLKALRNSLSAHILENVKIKNCSDIKQFPFLVKACWKIKPADKISSLGLVRKKINTYEMGMVAAK